MLFEMLLAGTGQALVKRLLGWFQELASQHASEISCS